jgi:hypothetical protein
MNDIKLLHAPTWRLCGTEWHLIVGNRSVAKLIPNFCAKFPQCEWISVIDEDYNSYGWDAVDFETLEIAKYDIEQWWAHMCRGVAFSP